jgi:hypothetical protein
MERVYSTEGIRGIHVEFCWESWKERNEWDISGRTML